MTMLRVVENDRKKPYTWRNAALDYLTGGIGQLQTNLVNHTNPEALLETLIGDLGKRDQNVAELQDLLQVFRMRKDGSVKAGRKPVSVGTTRDYSVQQVTNDIGDLGEPFLKIPVATLGMAKGSKGRVSFQNGVITIVPISAPNGHIDNIENECAMTA